jgi:xylose isomerase
MRHHKQLSIAIVINACRFFNLANDFKASIGFKSTLLLEPKPQEPTKHIKPHLS